MTYILEVFAEASDTMTVAYAVVYWSEQTPNHK